MVDERQTNLAQEAAKAAPPIGVSGAALFGYTLNDWILVFTLVYLICQVIVILPKAYRTIVSRRERKKGG
jgi:hypothetical protein